MNLSTCCPTIVKSAYTQPWNASLATLPSSFLCALSFSGRQAPPQKPVLPPSRLEPALRRSRLGCQIIASKDLDGLVVRIPSATRNMAVDGFRPKPH